MNSLRFVALIVSVSFLTQIAHGHPELFQLPWILPSLDPSNSFAAAGAAAQRPQQTYAPAPQPLAQQPQQQAFAPQQQYAPQPQQQQAFAPQQVQPQQSYSAQLQPQASQPTQQSFGYAPRSAPLPPAAFGVAQRAQPQPLSPTDSIDASRLAPFQAAATPAPVLNFPTQYPPSQPAFHSNSITAQQPQQQQQQQQQYAPQPATREPPVQNFWFKEGTPVLPCGYGLPPPEYNTPRKRCVPFSPLCGFAFTCIMDV